MKKMQWDPVKSSRLKRTRGVSVEEIVTARLIDKLKHPTKEHQRIMLFEYRNYMWLVPYVENDDSIF